MIHCSFFAVSWVVKDVELSGSVIYRVRSDGPPVILVGMPRYFDGIKQPLCPQVDRAFLLRERGGP